MNHQPEATPQNLYQITGNVADVNTVLIERAELHRLQAENNGLRILASGGMELFERYSTFKAKCEELEAMLDAVGAGGVGQSIKPAVQADTAQEPVAWRVRPFDYGIGYEGVDALTTRKEQCEMWERKGWKVEPLYDAPNPARQPLTDEQIQSILDRDFRLYCQLWEFIDIARAIEAAHGITESQP